MKVEYSSKINKEKDKKEFLREALIDLTKSKETPVDVLDCEFGEIVEKEREYILVTGDVDLNYSCTVGYDRQEEYYEQVRDYEKERVYNNGVKYYKNVKKTRTVTDWSPFSGTRTSTETTIVGNGDEEFRDSYQIGSCVKTSKEESFQDGLDCFDVCETSLEEAKQNCKRLCFAGATIPGDRKKDVDYSGTVDVKSVKGVIIPEYSVEYKYNEVDYAYENFACGDTEAEFYSPNDSGDVVAKAKKKTKPFIFVGIGVLVGGFIINCLGYLGLAFLIYSLGAGVFIAKYVIKNKIQNKEFNSRQEIKIEKLKKVLEKHGLKPLEENEI